MSELQSTCPELDDSIGEATTLVRFRDGKKAYMYFNPGDSNVTVSYGDGYVGNGFVIPISNSVELDLETAIASGNNAQESNIIINEVRSGPCRKCLIRQAGKCIPIVSIFTVNREVVRTPDSRNPLNYITSEMPLGTQLALIVAPQISND